MTTTLLVHNSMYDFVQENCNCWQLTNFFSNIIALSDPICTGIIVQGIYVNDTDGIQPQNVWLSCYFERKILPPLCTSDNYSTSSALPINGQLMCHNNSRDPRFVIWLRDNYIPLSVYVALPYALDEAVK